MGNFDLHGLLNTIAGNHGVTVPARNTQRKMRDAREGRNRDSGDEATARSEDEATSAPTDASMQLAQAETGAVTSAVGLIDDARLADDIIASGKADLVKIGRGALYNPRWAWHAAQALGAETTYPGKYFAAQPKFRPWIFAKP